MNKQFLTGIILGLTLLTGCTVNVQGNASPTPTATSTSTTTSTTSTETPAGSGEENAGTLAVTEFKFTESEGGAEVPDKKFEMGKKVFMQFGVEGFKQKDDKTVWLQEDLTVINPENEPILQQENLVDLNDKNTEDVKTVPFTNNVELKEGQPAGTYKVSMTIRDKVGNQTKQFEETFEVVEAAGGGDEG